MCSFLIASIPGAFFFFKLDIVQSISESWIGGKDKEFEKLKEEKLLRERLIGTSEVPLNKSWACSDLEEVRILFSLRRGEIEQEVEGLINLYAVKIWCWWESERNFLQWFLFRS